MSTKREESRETLDLIQRAHEAFGLARQKLKYDPCNRNYDLNSVKLRFQVKLLEGKGCLLEPKISHPIRNYFFSKCQKKTTWMTYIE